MSELNRPRHRTRVAALVAGIVGAAALGFGGSARAQAGVYNAEYADAQFQRRATELHVAPGEIDDQGTISEVLEASIHQEKCQRQSIVTIDVSTAIEAADLPGVEVASRDGSASVSGMFTLTGEMTTTPAGRGCATPMEDQTTTTPITIDLQLDARWKNLAGSVPIIYSGEDCGGTGVCYYRDARARGTWSADLITSGSVRSTSGFLFEGTYAV